MSSTATQADRPLKVRTPLGENALLLVRLTAREELSALFSFELDVLAESGVAVEFDKLLGQTVTAELRASSAPPRYFSGICCRLWELDAGQDFKRFRLEVVPKLWLLTRRSGSRIFQQVSVPDILKKVLAGIDVKWEIQGTFEPRNYCVQYRESDFAFASRIMEEEGIYYYFTHSADGHRMVVANTPQNHADIDGSPTVVFEQASTERPEADRVLDWRKGQEIRAAKCTLWDHSFELPGKNLEAPAPILDSVEVGTVTHKQKLPANADLELYDYPGAYAQRFDGVDPHGGDRASDVQKIFKDNKRTAQIRAEQETVPGIEIRGAGNCGRFAAGHCFELTNRAGADGRYVLTRVVHESRSEAAYSSSDVGEAFTYSNTFACIPVAQPYRPQRTTAKPFVQGVQTGTVVGPAGEEIFTDKYGRVKVQLPWDREGKKDAGSSCWMRVASTWAGKQWGAVHIPRIGQEVVVAFLEGDPDRPIVVGSVYNAEQMPPYALPDNKTQSGVKSRSTLQGSTDNFNEIRFEDKKGSEEIYVHAEKNFTRIVENDDVLQVGLSKKDPGSQTIEIQGDRTETVKEGDESVTIEKGDRTVTVTEGDDVHAVKAGKRTVTVSGDDFHQVEKGNRTVQVDEGNDLHTVKKGKRDVVVEGGDDTHMIKKGDRVVQIDMGNDTLTIKMGNRKTKLDMGTDTIEATQSIELKVGQSSLKLDPAGVTIKGMMVKIEGQTMTQVKGLMTQVNGDAMLTVKGGLTMIN